MSSLLLSRASSTSLFEDILVFADPSVLDLTAQSDDETAAASAPITSYFNLESDKSWNWPAGNHIFQMETLPIELLTRVLDFADLEAVKALRLTSKLWAELGESYLIHPRFFLLSYRDDINRLSELAKHPRLQYNIETLIFQHGEINEYHARHNTYFLNYMQDPDTRLESQTSSMDTYTELRAQKERYLPNACDKDILLATLGLLPNLTRIDVSLMACPFQEEGHPEMLKDIWNIPSTRLMPRVATTERFTNLILAVASNINSISITNLSHDRLPFEFFAQRPATIRHLSDAFISLTTLDLAIDYSDMPNNLHNPQAFQTLGLCIMAATQLRSLNLEFFARRKIDVLNLLTFFRTKNYVLSHLEHLALRGITSTEEDLGNFLIGQKSLKVLQLGGLGLKTRHQPPNGGVYLSEGSFKDLFARVSNALDLEILKVQGDLVGEVSGERWILENAEDVHDLWEFVMD